MNRVEYIKELKKYLNNLSDNDRRDAIEYCNQYFDEAGMSNEENAIKELGLPKQFANSLIANITIKNDTDDEYKNDEKKKKSKGDIKTIWIVLLAIAALPFGLPIIISILAVIFGLLVAGICIVFAIGVSIFAIPFGIILGFPIGNTFFSGIDVNGFVIVGIILLSISVLILSVIILYNVVKLFISLIKKIVIIIYNKINKNNITSDISDNDLLINKNYVIKESIKEVYIETNGIEIEVIKSETHSNIEIELKKFKKEKHFYFNVDTNILTIKSIYDILFGHPKIIMYIPNNMEFDIFNVKSTGSKTLLKNILSKKVELKNNAGMLVFSGNAIYNLDLENMAGQSDIELVTNTKNIVILNDKGDIKVNTVDINKYSYSLSNHAGNIKIGGKLYDGLNNDVIIENGETSIKVKNDMGRIIIR